MSKSFLRLAILCAPFVLTACGDGWEAQKTDTYFPYGNQRTAGSGVVYVRAKMMPEKKMVLEPVMEKVEPKPATVEPVLEADDIFSDAQKKGAPAKATQHAAPAEKHSSLIAPSTVEPSAGTPVPEVEMHAALDSWEEVPTVSVAPADHAQITAEDYIAQAPKRIIARKVEVIKTNVAVSSDNAINAVSASDTGFDGEEMVEIFENEVIQPQKEIIAPKKDPNGFLSVGQETLDEIYNNDF
tara:strand:- start:18005 stop:18727 length:723 start_codon:yes stop_codon:yes gene_type:complete